MSNPILLVEDNPGDLELTLLALEQAELDKQLVVVRDGAEALEYLQRRGKYTSRVPGNPAVVLLDLKMPKLDGLEVLDIVRGDVELQNIPIVMLTSSDEGPDLQSAYQAGVNAYVVKPLRFAEFVSLIGGLGVFWGVSNKPPSHGRATVED